MSDNIEVIIEGEEIEVNISHEGLSAYEVAVLNGFPGTEAEWLEAGQPELQKSATHIQYKLKGEDTWTNLVALDDIKGSTGAPFTYADFTPEQIESLKPTVTHQDLTFANPTIWNYALGNSAMVAINASNPITLTNVTGRRVGVLEVRHLVAGTTIVLPGNTMGVGWNPNVYNSMTGEGITKLGFDFNGYTFTWYSNVLPTVATDTTPPTLLSASVSNTLRTRIVLAYNESLLSLSTPATTDFTVSGGKTVTGVSISGLYVYVDVNTAYAPGNVITISYTGGTNKIKDLAGNIAANLVAQSVTNNIETVLAGTAGLPAVDTAFKNGTNAPFEFINLVPSTQVATAGTVNKIKFVLSEITPGMTFWVSVLRKDGSTYDLVSKLSYAAADLVVGVNEKTVTPFNVLVGDYTSLGCIGAAAAIMPAESGASGSSRYIVAGAVPATYPDYNWDGKAASIGYSIVQLIQS